MTLGLPEHVRRHVGAVFAQVNNAVSNAYGANPNTQEEQLDGLFIHELQRRGTSVRLADDWIVRVDTHYLGGLRHWERWEIADIGLLVVVRDGGQVTHVKTAALQSKRLYANEVREETELERADYSIGFARLYRGTGAPGAILGTRAFTFDHESRYRALHVGDEQWRAIAAYETNNFPVHYLLYHPPRAPWSTQLPLEAPVADQTVELGARVMRACDVRAAAANKEAGYQPSFGELRAEQSWLLETFVADELLACREGKLTSENDATLDSLFYRRSGPISAAFAVTIDHGAPP